LSLCRAAAERRPNPLFGYSTGGLKNETDRLLSQSGLQVAAAGSRSIVWYFAEQAAADYAAELFRERNKGREQIIIEVVPAEVQ